MPDAAFHVSMRIRAGESLRIRAWGRVRCAVGITFKGLGTYGPPIGEAIADVSAEHSAGD